jgi:hypothetical protein
MKAHPLCFLLVVTGLLLTTAFDANAQRFRQPTVDAQTAAIRQQTDLLHNRAIELRELVDTHLDNYRQRPTEAEEELRISLTELFQEAGSLKQEAYSNPSARKLHRSFHLVEYWFNDSWGLAVESGYARSLAPYFRQLEADIEELARCGFRNPRIDALSLSRRVDSYNSYRGPRTPQPVPYPNPNLPGTQAPPLLERDPNPRQQQDLGDLLRRLFGR